MSKNKKQQERIRLNEEKANIFRDSKRRIVYPINYSEQAYVLNPDSLGRVSLYDTRIIFAMIPIALIFGLTGQFLFLACVFGGAVYLGLTFYFHKFFFPKLRIMKMKPEDYAYTISLNVLKLKRKERVIRGLLGASILTLVIIYISATLQAGNVTTWDIATSFASVFIIGCILAVELKDYFILNRLIKNSQ